MLLFCIWPLTDLLKYFRSSDCQRFRYEPCDDKVLRLLVFFYNVLEGYLYNCIVVFNRAHVAFNQCSFICEWIMQ